MVWKMSSRFLIFTIIWLVVLWERRLSQNNGEGMKENDVFNFENAECEESFKQPQAISELDK